MDYSVSTGDEHRRILVINNGPSTGNAQLFTIAQPRPGQAQARLRQSGKYSFQPATKRPTVIDQSCLIGVIVGTSEA